MKSTSFIVVLKIQCMFLHLFLIWALFYWYIQCNFFTCKRLTGGFAWTSWSHCFNHATMLSTSWNFGAKKLISVNKKKKICSSLHHIFLSLAAYKIKQSETCKGEPRTKFRESTQGMWSKFKPRASRFFYFQRFTSQLMQRSYSRLSKLIRKHWKVEVYWWKSLMGVKIIFALQH